MTETFNRSVFQTTYRDDFAESDGFHRILFNSGRFLQARELTQMQTMIQQEITRFGNNIFKEGATVQPGGLTVNAGYEFIKLNTSTNPLPSNFDALVGTEFTGDTTGNKFRILEVLPAAGSDPATLYVQYFDTPNASQRRALPGEQIDNGVVNLTVQTINTTANPAVGQGVKASVAPGSFYVQGRFVFSPAQSIFLKKYDNQYTGTLGFRVAEDIVTANDDVSLYDNQGTTPNLTSPGADRYRIRLILTDQVDVDSDQTFVYFARVVNSRVVQQQEGTEDYNKINDLLALRTKEESGNYIVNPFLIRFSEHDSDNSKLYLTVSEGTAYINGYRASRPTETRLEINKPQTTEEFNNQGIAATYGNYININDIRGLPNITTFEKQNIRDTVAYGGSTIGTCRVKAVEEDGALYRLYIFDIQMNTGFSFRNARSIGTSVTQYANIALTNGQATLVQPNINSLLFPLPRSRPQSLTDVALTVQRRFVVATNGAGEASVSISSAGQVFTNLSNWLVTDETTGFLPGVTLSGAGTQAVTITGAPPSTTIYVIGYVFKGLGSIRTKTLVETSNTFAPDSNGNVTFGVADIYQVDSIKDSDSDGVSLVNRYSVDTGQRDNYYGLGRLLLRNGRSAPTGNVFVRYKYFTHGASGDFFSVNSYSGQVDYASIPSFRRNNGEVVSLREVLDFRPVVNSSGEFTGSGIVNDIPQNTSLVQADVTYYRGRRDILSIGEQGNLKLILGDESLDPKYPSITDDVLPLYRIALNPNTLGPSDTRTSVIEAKRYTMADIGRLEQQIEKLREITTLSLLELSTSNIAVLDDSGFDRTKAGFFVDNFSDHFFSETSSIDYRASIDPRARLVRPIFNEQNIRLIYDSDLSTNTVLRGDNIYLKYSSVPYIDQPVASGIENVNPFAVVTGQGEVELSPASDEWREVNRLADRVVSSSTVLDTSQALLWNNWQWNWTGESLNELEVGSELGRQTATETSVNTGTFERTRRDVSLLDFARWRGFEPTGPRAERMANEFFDELVEVAPTTTTTTTTTTVDRVASESTIREVLGDRVVDVALIPFMRSRKVYFRAEGLRPNTTFFPYLGANRISEYTREEPFKRFATDPTDAGNTFEGLMDHPDGSTNLVSDANGELTGSFLVPNNNTLRYRAGTIRFQLYDVTGTAAERAANSLSSAETTYTARGVIETRQRDVSTTRVLHVVGNTEVVTETRESEEIRIIDPLAQSILVDEPDGVFVDRVRVYFATKDSSVPVRVQIRPMINGFPAAYNFIAQKILPPAQVNVTPLAGATNANVYNNPTDFVFDEPVYLNPYTEYAIVVLADTVGYNVYVAGTGEFILGSTERRINSQPSLGSLFKSQNGFTWTPSQNQDLMFTLFRCQFLTASGEAHLSNTDVPRNLTPQDPIETTAGSRKVFVFNPNHGLIPSDSFTLSGLDSSATYAGISGATLNGPHFVDSADWVGYTFTSDSAATISDIVGGDRVQSTINYQFDVVHPFIQTQAPPSTALALSGKFITGQSWAGNQTRYVRSGNWLPLSNRGNNSFNSPRMIANRAEEITELGGDRSAQLRIQLQTLSNRVSPVIDMQRASLFLINNVIDNQDSAASSGFNIPVNFVPETAPSGGSAASKHIARQQTLEEDAVGLKIIVAANRPPSASFDVYYRVAEEGVSLSEINWTLVEEETNNPADDNPAIYRNYEYIVGGPGGTLEPFTQYQIKIVMNSINSSTVPVLRDLRVIALVD